MCLTGNGDMETNPEFQSVGNQPMDGHAAQQPGPGPRRAKTLEPVTPEFVLDSIRCDVESRLHERFERTRICWRGSKP